MLYTPDVKITFLGTGTSHGIPMIGCSCDVCVSENPKNKRTRCSVWIEEQDTSILIDTATDFRTQALREGIHDIDAVLLTHAHADHVHGLDDIRAFTYRHPIPVYGNAPTIDEVTQRFAYIFTETQEGGGKPKIDLHTVSRPFHVGPVRIVPVPITHGELSILGFRIGDFVYLTDCSGIPEESYAYLQNIDVAVIGALRYRPHETHYSVSQAVAEIEKISPRRAYLTHLCHRLEHETLLRELPRHIRPAWDGLTLFV
jgi:phosphoribosyl 1,2-cyclic phosphate phosphodiesterase